MGRKYTEEEISMILDTYMYLGYQEASKEPVELKEVIGKLSGVPEYGRWAIVEGVGENCLFLRDDFTCHDYGKTWLAYRHKPEEELK